MGMTVDFHDDGCAVIMMKNGENRWNPQTVRQLNEALDQVERNDSVKVLVTTGEGKFFSNGFDLDFFKSHKSEQEQCLIDLTNVLWRIMHFPLPTVAAINGHCFAGGAFFAMCHDYRVMRPDRGWISWNEILIHLRASGPFVEILKRKVNAEALRESVIFAKRITGPEAVRLKLVDATAPLSDLIDRSKIIGLAALGKNVIQRTDLHYMKKDLYPRNEELLRSNL